MHKEEQRVNEVSYEMLQREQAENEQKLDDLTQGYDEPTDED